ncbi:MAG: sigma factor, partial [Pseudomonadota bacterium]
MAEKAEKRSSIEATDAAVGPPGCEMGQPRVSAADRETANDDIAALYRDHAGSLVASLRSTFGNGPPDPADVAQHAFQKLIERRDRSDIQDLRAFLWRTACNAFLKAIKKDDVRSRYDFEVEQLFFPARG